MQPNHVIVVNLVIASVIIPVTSFAGTSIEAVAGTSIAGGRGSSDRPHSVKYSAVLIAEPMANLLLALSFLCLVALLQARYRRHVLILGCAAGTLIVLSSLARPASTLCCGSTNGGVGCVSQTNLAGFGCFEALVGSGLCGTLLWRIHNATFYGNFSFTTIGTYNLLYYRAGSVLYHATGENIESVYGTLARQVEEELGNDCI